ncbi:putative transmembrane family 234 protein [Plasmopara halstedii]
MQFSLNFQLRFVYSTTFISSPENYRFVKKRNMNTPVSTLLSFLFVGALWGCTNPLIKRGSNDNVMYTRKDNSIEEFVKQFVGLVKNWQFLVPFALNQSGSVVYVYLLGSVDISNAVPISNSLTFVFTAITSRLLGEKPQRPRSTYTGMVLILLGVAICLHSK